MRKSILFVCPDYHCSFIYRDELRRMGWRANVYVPEGYPAKLLYSEEDLVSMPKEPLHLYSGRRLDMLIRAWASMRKLMWLLRQIVMHKYIFYYGGLEALPLLFANKAHDEPQVSRTLALARRLGNKIIHLPSGCLEQETKENFSKLDGGNVCGNCGWGSEVCNDKKNVARFDLVRRYADMAVGMGDMDSSQYKATHFKYKSLDLNLWKPDLEIPEEHRLSKTNKLRILHSFFDKNRDVGRKNIKGSPAILDAFERLKKEGYPVEYIYLNDIPSKDMRFYQAQVDILVEQLIYGWWGSTGVETMALGKPVVCYLRPSWRKFFLKKFPEYTALPIVEANTQNIYEVLKKLVTDKEYRERKGKESREFAERHFDVKKNAKNLVEILSKL